MFATRIFRLFLLALGVAAIAQALRPDAQFYDEEDALLVKRQSPSATGNADTTATSSPPTSPTDEPTETSTPSTTRRTDSTTPSTTRTSSRPTTSNEPDKTTSKTPEPTTETQTFTTTNPDGSIETRTSETTSTPTPGLSDENKSGGGSGGMSTGTRNIVIGVVVGVGGAIVLGALAFVAFRVWGRKRGADENDGLMNYNTGYAPMDKPEGGSSGGVAPAARNPFQSTLESYHQPTQVNASSNF
jgi:cytoskeletal protein RodZ